MLRTDALTTSAASSAAAARTGRRAAVGVLPSTFAVGVRVSREARRARTGLLAWHGIA